jgi:NADP-dependent 3-hydroxy acid dehydrogenase YdfG
MKAAIVTGASSGFGEAISLMLLGEGYRVYGLARRYERLKNTFEKFKNFVPYEINLLGNKEIETFFKKIGVDKNLCLLVNCAGLALGADPYDQMKLKDVDTMIGTNITALAHMIHHFLKTENKEKYIINLGSIAGNYVYPNNNVYGGTKAFVNHFSKNLRSDLLGKNIRITSIEPGLAKTEFSLVRLKGNREKAEAIYKNTEYIKATDIAEIVKMLIHLPKHLNINSIEVMPITQSNGPLQIYRFS